MAKKIRLTITVPIELVRRLDPFRNEVNVSKVCSDALEAEISGREASVSRALAIGSAIIRLRADKKGLSDDGKEEKEGEEAGRKWALTVATYDQLSTIPHAYLRAQGKPDARAAAIDEIRRLRGFSMSGFSAPNWPAFWYGFLRGARQVWDEVKDSVEAP